MPEGFLIALAAAAFGVLFFMLGYWLGWAIGTQVEKLRQLREQDEFHKAQKERKSQDCVRKEAFARQTQSAFHSELPRHG